MEARFFFQQHRWGISAVILVAAVLLMFTTSVEAKVSQKRIRQEYRAMLEREPTVFERTERNVLKGNLDGLRKILSAHPERRRLITTLYRQLLLRSPRPHEFAEWTRIMAPMQNIREHMLALPERQTLMDDLYLAYFGRYPNDHERESNNRRGVSYEKLREALKTGAERSDAIIARFGQVLGREPDGTELNFFLTTGQPLDVIGQNTPPVAVAGEDRSVPNDIPMVTLDGSESTDLEGSPLTYVWKMIETPPEAAVTLSDVSAIRPSFAIPVDPDDSSYRSSGTYRFQLVVSDGQSMSAPDEIEIHVLSETSVELQLLAAVNTIRAGDDPAKAAPDVKLTTALTRAARKYSRALFVYGWFESVDPAGRTPADRARAEGYVLKRVGENIALIKSKKPIRVTEKRVHDIFDGWLASSAHKKNIMLADFTETGIGFYSGRFGANEYRLYAVQMFAVPKPDLPAESSKVPETSKSQETTPPPVPPSASAQPTPPTTK